MTNEIDLPASLKEGMSKRRGRMARKNLPTKEQLQEVHEQVDPFAAADAVKKAEAAKKVPEAIAGGNSGGRARPVKKAAAKKKAVDAKWRTYCRLDAEDRAVIEALSEERDWSHAKTIEKIVKAWINEGKHKSL